MAVCGLETMRREEPRAKVVRTRNRVQHCDRILLPPVPGPRRRRRPPSATRQQWSSGAPAAMPQEE